MENFIKSYDENSVKGYILEVNIEYPKNLHDLHNDLQFLPERIKIKKCNKLVCNLYDKNNVVNVRTLKQELNHGLILQKVHKVIQFNQKMILKKIFFKLVNNAVFGKTMENVRKHRDIKLTATNKRKNYLVSKPNYHTKK